MMSISGAAIAEPAAVREFCQRWAQAWNDHDGDAVAALCAEDLVYDEPALGDTVHGRDAIRDFVVNMDADFPDHRFFLEGLYADVARPAVLVAWRFSGTHAATGRRLEFHGDDRLELGEDGLIGAYRCLYDNDLVLRQLGKKRPR
ncbi:SnoaL-like domain protein [Mycobacterium bohemicum DSM 44277]|uniref:SnoaL-like domain protein n=1 Tax=Mycobacterium bohemicum DSM 44277 TaxID=1236609 RepID=A0A0U0W8U1_MYCBE|nr:nuclear transport factor 2 family protein [Mycobacterium bohemicum]MCV6972619.1 nuclear transport factor 2 family protein [Mycobacterium bohemicum]CPR10685.1 SnoaL-like domain protein [Mycobacterium bohemicum DSM 44277]